MLGQGLQGRYEYLDGKTRDRSVPVDRFQNDPDNIVDGYTMNRDDKGLIRIQVNVESDQLFFLYSQLLALNRNYKVFWYIIHLDDEEEMQFLINEHFNTPSRFYPKRIGNSNGVS